MGTIINGHEKRYNYYIYGACGYWIPFSKYLRMGQCTSLAAFIQDGYGKLAEGPKVLMEKYAKILTRHSIRSSIIDVHPAVHREDGQCKVKTDDLKVMLLDDDGFFIAREFKGVAAASSWWTQDQKLADAIT